MNLRVFWSSAFILLIVNFTSARASKCRGRWAIHACAAGNGKRSGPLYPPDDDTDSDAAADNRQKLVDLIQQLKLQAQPQMPIPTHVDNIDEPTPEQAAELWNKLLAKMRSRDLLNA